MVYNYNGLWKMLIDHNLTKTEMRKQAGISTNILAKMGKGEPVAMESLAKICATLGSYYTPQKIACNMTKDFDFSKGQLFFDPCCGSGAFLLTVTANEPSQLYGVDNDKVAVLISKINMLLKYIDSVYPFNKFGVRDILTKIVEKSGRK